MKECKFGNCRLKHLSVENMGLNTHTNNQECKCGKCGVKHTYQHPQAGGSVDTYQLKLNFYEDGKERLHWRYICKFWSKLSNKNSNTIMLVVSTLHTE